MSRSASNDCVIGLPRNLDRIIEVFEVNSAENCAKKRKEKFENSRTEKSWWKVCATGMRERHRMEHWNDKSVFGSPPLIWVC